jgi:nucleoside diphosphate kinase
MTSTRQLFEKQQAGITVYSPDCGQSRLWGNLDHAIHDATGFQPIHRHWINHDYNSIVRFYTSSDEAVPEPQDPEEAARKYDNIPAEDLKYGHLVVKLFLSGPSLLTIWRGDAVIETLTALKGATHPAEAAAESIRGRFWCDNAVCNLIHTSDNTREAEREIGSVGLSERLDYEGAALALIDPIPIGYAPHSGISVVYEVVRRSGFTSEGIHHPVAQLPVSGSARETNRLLTEILQKAAQQQPASTTARFITAYLSGDIVLVTALLKQMPVTQWEHFAVQCSTITRDKWTV